MRCVFLFMSRYDLKNLSAWHSLRCRMIRAGSFGIYDHVSIGFGDVVMTPDFNGYKFWPSSKYLKYHKSVKKIYRVPLEYDLDLSWFDGAKHPGFLSPMLRWMSLGYCFWNTDCICAAIECLQAGGVDVPDTITSPSGLDRWLTKKRYDNVRTTERHRPTPPDYGFDSQVG